MPRMGFSSHVGDGRVESDSRAGVGSPEPELLIL